MSSQMTCACGNRLTVEDRGLVCRQCVLAARIPGASVRINPRTLGTRPLPPTCPGYSPSTAIFERIPEAKLRAEVEES